MTNAKGNANRLPVLICLLLATIVPARAEDCRTIESVQNSAVPGNNTEAGGHLTGHIKGATPPSGWDYSDKSLFTSEAEFIGAWRNFIKNTTIPKLNCSGTAQHQSVAVQTLLSKPSIGAVSCRNATCSESNKTQFSRIFFGYILVKGKWILNTAFPSE